MPKKCSSSVRRFPARRSPAKTVETLETRELLSVSVGANGFTVVTPSATDRVIYCSSSTGNDNNTGLSPSAPVATLARAESMLRNDHGDELLLKAGDTWTGSFVFWKLSGASAQDPMVLGSYGTGARPTIDTGTGEGFVAGCISTPEVDNVDILGIHFLANGRDPALTKTPDAASDPTGIEFLSKSANIVIDNCQTEYYSLNINLQGYYGPQTNITVTHTVSDYSWSGNSHSQGLYALNISGLTLNDDVFIHNGWNPLIPSAAPTFFNHDCYIAGENSNVVVENSIFAEASGFGLQDRPGGIIENNVFINDPVGMTFGLVDGATTTAGGVTGIVSGNIFIGGASNDAISASEGIEVGNIKPGVGAVITDNIFTQAPSTAQTAIELTHGYGQPNPQQAVGINNLTIKSNIFYQQTNGIYIDNGQVASGSGIAALNDLSILNNKFEDLSLTAIKSDSPSYASQLKVSGNESYDSDIFTTNLSALAGTIMKTAMPFPAPARNIGTYDASIGNSAASVADLLTREMAQSQQHWNTALTAQDIVAYMQAGFGLPVTSVTPPSATSSGSTSLGSVTTEPAKSVFNATKPDDFLHYMPSTPATGLGGIGTGQWIEYNHVDFGSGVSTFTADLSASEALGGGEIQIRTVDPTGPIIGTLKVTPTGSGSTAPFVQESTPITGATGVHDLYLVFVGKTGFMQLMSFKFS